MPPKDEDAEAEKQPQVSGVRIWLEEQWEGWLKSLLPMILLGGAYLLYKSDMLGENVTTITIVVAMCGGGIASAVWPMWGVATGNQRLATLAVGVLAALATAAPALQDVLPYNELGEVHLDEVNKSGKITTSSDGPFDLVVRGHFRNMGSAEVEASYNIKVAGANGTNEEISGSISRETKRVRTGRRGGSSTSVQEHTENRHHMATVRGKELTVSVDDIDQQLDGKLWVALRRASMDPTPLFVLAALLLCVALVLDVKVTDEKGKVKPYLGAMVAMALAFSLVLKKEVMGDAVFAGVAAAAGGWLFGWIGRFMWGPKKAKAKARR